MDGVFCGTEGQILKQASHQVMSLLLQNNIASDNSVFSPITAGLSGAQVFLCDNRYVIKYASSSILNDVVMGQCKNEYGFYKMFTDKIDFIPEVVLQFSNDEEIMIVFKKYEAIPNSRWDEALQKYAMDLCAQINALDCNASHNRSWLETEQEPGQYPLSESHENWNHLQVKFSEHINASLLNEMYADFYEIAAYTEKLPIPKTFCHGDFAPANFLLDKDKLLVCDWQDTHIGTGIGAVTYFLQQRHRYGYQNKSRQDDTIVS